ncbi:hypothetical protein [Asticcacaulis sp. EMRT-3]|uniref:hypothetical protein n=1 Tax=Asticcacaulis sp. EMRT-3 TaxID=3040349 RepID=UPI0024AEC48B|nr:hypothetical protein [Asticcacaulis sp. EMRT-3]MDI7774209.1 hypothetical protein [Asticcacaulis sp. EMRT-3]
MDAAAERLKCMMEAIDHGLTVEEALEECPHCAPQPGAAGYDDGSLRHDNMGWQAPTAFSETL